MLRTLLTLALTAPTGVAPLSAHAPTGSQGQTLAQRFQDAWASYAKLEATGDEEQEVPPGLPDALDELGRAWAAWVEAQESPSTKLPALPGSGPAPSARLLGRRGPWILLGLEVAVPCGSHLFLALFREQAGHGKLVMLDLHEARSEADPLGAREHVQALLLEGPKVVVASTPPWCTSCWSVLHVRAEGPGADALHPSVMTHFEDSVYRCADRGALQATPLQDGFRIRYEGMGPDGTTVPRSKTFRVP